LAVPAPDLDDELLDAYAMLFARLALERLMSEGADTDSEPSAPETTHVTTD